MSDDIYTNYYSNYILNFNPEKTTLEELKLCKKIQFNSSLKVKQCPISLENFKENEDLLELPCGHYFSENKIRDWLNKKTTCPVCRHNLRDSNKHIVRQQFDYIIDIVSENTLLQQSESDGIDNFELF